MSFVLRRAAARVICFNPQGEVLLIRAADPVDRAKPPWWELPGGGIDVGETPEHAILRELREEAGVRHAEVGPCVWTQHAQFTFSGWNFDQHERIYVATCDGDTSGELRLEAFEAAAFQGERWWAIEDLLANPEPTVPPRLRDFLPAIAAGHRPDPPIDITPLDHSLADHSRHDDAK